MESLEDPIKRVNLPPDAQSSQYDVEPTIEDNGELETPPTAESLGSFVVSVAENTPDSTPKSSNSTKKKNIDRSGKKPKGYVPKPKGKGHFSKQIKTQLTAQGKLNAKEPMPKEQKRARRRKK